MLPTNHFGFSPEINLETSPSFICLYECKVQRVIFYSKGYRSQISYELWMGKVLNFVPVPTINLATDICLYKDRQTNIGSCLFRNILLAFKNDNSSVDSKSALWDSHRFYLGMHRLWVKVKGSVVRTRGVSVRQFLMALIDLQRPSWSLRRSRRVLPRQVSVRLWNVLSLYFSFKITLLEMNIHVLVQ